MSTNRWWKVLVPLGVAALGAVVALRVVTSGPVTLWVYAHPDDETLTAAGAMVEEREQGEHIVLILTNGGATRVTGTPGNPDDATAIGEAREREARAALEVVELRDVRFGGLPDGGVTVDEAERVIREHLDGVAGPVAVRGHSPLDAYGDYGQCGHPDHCATAYALLRLHEEGLFDELRLYRIQQFFDGPPAGTCQTLSDHQQAVKQEMRDQYGYQDPAAGRYGIAASSVPGPWEATETAPECFDTPEEAMRTPVPGLSGG